jgi:hypothetical protein
MECKVGWRLAVVCVAALGLSALAGCGSSSAASTHKVSGKVTSVDGTPVKGAAVGFSGTGSKAFSATGTTVDDGTYTLSTFEENDGAPEGEYSVSVTDSQGNVLAVEGASTVTVKPGANTIDIKVQGGSAAAAPVEGAAP